MYYCTIYRGTSNYVPWKSDWKPVAHITGYSLTPFTSLVITLGYQKLFAHL